MKYSSERFRGLFSERLVGERKVDKNGLKCVINAQYFSFFFLFFSLEVAKHRR